jgi:polysaccharide export outer membrane protein
MSKLPYASALSFLFVTLLTACGGPATLSPKDVPNAGAAPLTDYRVGPGDSLQIFVWDQPDLSTSVIVRPDGRISTPLVEDLDAAGSTPTELARQIETVLSGYVRGPVVTVIVQGFVGEIDRQVRVVGQAVEPRALQYREGMTVLDVVIEVGGLTDFAAGNRARIVRLINGRQTEIRVRLDDLLNDGRMGENVAILPGDVLIIPQSVF